MTKLQEELQREEEEYEREEAELQRLDELGNFLKGIDKDRWLMGNDIGSGSVTGCCLWSLGNLRQHTELHYIGWAKIKTNWTQTDVITH